jgi:hypothetical protein
MNAPTPVQQSSVPAATPTIGAALGGIAATVIQSHVSDPTVSSALLMFLPSIFAWFSHKAHASWLNSQI